MLISVVIPFYNAKKHVDNMVNNISIQTYRNIEVVFVDDGSIDGTMELIKQKNLDPLNVKYVKKKNGGPSSARNKGIEVATGEYIVFWDADDVVSSNAIEILVDSVKKDDIAMMSIFKRYIDNTKKTDIAEETDIKEGSNNLFEVFSDILSMNDVYFITICNKIYNLDIIRRNKLRFDENIHWAEDLKWNVEYFEHVNRIGFSKQGRYIYCISGNEKSLSKKYNKNNVDSLNVTLREMLEKIEKKNIKNKEDCYMWCIRCLISNVANVFGDENDGFFEKLTFIRNNGFASIKEWGKNAEARSAIEKVILLCAKHECKVLLTIVAYVLFVLRKKNKILYLKRINKK